MFWTAPDQWRRVIQTDEFSQTLVVNGSFVSEQDSDDYFPLWLNTLVTAMVDPSVILNSVRAGDKVYTKANGASSESGVICYGKGICASCLTGLQEIVNGSGHSVTFTDYHKFEGKRMARLLLVQVTPGYGLRAEITKLEKLKSADPALFSISIPTEKRQQIKTAFVPPDEFRHLAVQIPQLIWPQVLDGAETGPAIFYLSLDRTGRVREVLPLHTSNERANESAMRQIMNWRFQPIERDGAPVQMESLISLAMNTRAFGPKEPLTDVQVRDLATNTVNPAVAPGSVPLGTTVTLRIAVDHEGKVIEIIGSGGPPSLLGPSLDAIGKWKFSPFMQDGKPLPYRGEVIFRF